MTVADSELIELIELVNAVLDASGDDTTPFNLSICGMCEGTGTINKESTDG